MPDEEIDARNIVNSLGLSLDKDMTLIGVFGIRDDLRPGIKDAVERCHQAYVNVRMVTGDNQETAVAIAKELKIIPSDHNSASTTEEDIEDKKNPNRFRCMTGAEFRKRIGGLSTEIIDGESKEVITNIQAFREIVG